METIIGLLIVILPIVFKLIGKKLEQAAQASAPQTEPVEDWAETLRRHLDAQQQMQSEAPVPAEAEVETPVLLQPAAQKVKDRPVFKASKAKNKAAKPILKEEPEREKEKIDVKKMIIYSEIMKPKY